MTQAPQYPLEHSYLGDADPMEMIDTRIGPMQRWRADALLIGETSGLIALRDHIKNDAVSALDELEQRERTVAAREARCDQRERSLAATAARLNDEIGRAAEQWDKIEQARADQEREQEPVAKPPGRENDAALPGDPNPVPNSPADPAPGTASDEVEDDPPLHSILAKQNPDPVAPDAGPPPPSVPLSYVHGGDQVEFPDPEQARPPVQQQPISAGLD